MKILMFISMMFIALPTLAKAQQDKDIIISEAAKMGITAPVVSAIAKRESGFRCSPNNPRYNGPLQISKASARALGYNSSDGPLNNCRAGLKYGLRHLKLCVNKVGQNPAKAMRCHSMPGTYGVRLIWSAN